MYVYPWELLTVSRRIAICRLTFLTPCSCLIFAFRFIWSLASLMANFLASLLSARPALCSVVSFCTWENFQKKKNNLCQRFSTFSLWWLSSMKFYLEKRLGRTLHSANYFLDNLFHGIYCDKCWLMLHVCVECLWWSMH